MLAQLARPDWDAKVHIRSELADRLRTLIGARTQLLRCGAITRAMFGACRRPTASAGARLESRAQRERPQEARDDRDSVLGLLAEAFATFHRTLSLALKVTKPSFR